MNKMFGFSFSLGTCFLLNLFPNKARRRSRPNICELSGRNTFQPWPSRQRIIQCLVNIALQPRCVANSMIVSGRTHPSRCRCKSLRGYLICAVFSSMGKRQEVRTPEAGRGDCPRLDITEGRPGFVDRAIEVASPRSIRNKSGRGSQRVAPTA